MTQDRDLPLGDLGRIAVDDTPARGRPASPPPTAPPTPPRPPAPSTRPARRGGTALWAVSILLLLGLVGGLAGYLYQELRSVQRQLDERLAASTSELSDKLSAADQTLVQTSGQMQEQLKALQAEVATLTRQGRQQAEQQQALERQLETLTRRNTELNSALTGLRSDLDKSRSDLRQQVTTAGQATTALKQQLEQLTTQRDQMQTQVDALAESLRMAEAKVATAQQAGADFKALMPQLQALAQVQKRGSGLEARLKDIEAAISTFDAYRIQVNNRLDALQTPSQGR